MNLKIMKKSLILLFIFSFMWAQLPLGELNDPNPFASEVIRLNQTSEGSTESAEICVDQTAPNIPSSQGGEDSQPIPSPLTGEDPQTIPAPLTGEDSQSIPSPLTGEGKRAGQSS